MLLNWYQITGVTLLAEYTVIYSLFDIIFYLKVARKWFPATSKEDGQPTFYFLVGPCRVEQLQKFPIKLFWCSPTWQLDEWTTPALPYQWQFQSSQRDHSKNLLQCHVLDNI